MKLISEIRFIFNNLLFIRKHANVWNDYFILPRTIFAINEHNYITINEILDTEIMDIR